MKKIILSAERQTGLTIMIFVEGTIMKPKAWWALYNHQAYVPIGNAVHMIISWQQQGANIVYCTSRRKKKAEIVAALLRKYSFTGTFMAVREHNEFYQDIVEALQPDILIEDDCRSIGGAWQMCMTKVKPEIKEKICHVVVPEFKGIDSLPSRLEELRSWQHK